VGLVIACLIPLIIGTGTSSEVIQRIVGPMVGGMITPPLLSMFVVPAVYLLLRRRQIRLARREAPDLAEDGFVP